MSSFMTTLIASIFVFGLLIMFHELGHFIMAKSVNIKVNEFSIGFGPILLKKSRGETLYSVRVLPLGGYVKMEGEDEASEDERSFSKKPPLQRMAVIAAGPIMNFVLAILLIALISFFVGIATTEIGAVVADSPAEQSGIKPGDRIVSINDIKITQWEQVVSIIGSNPEKTLKIVVERDKKLETYNVKPVKKAIQNGGYRGVIGIESRVKKYSILVSLENGIQRTYWMTKMIFLGLINMILGKIKPDIVGPVGIIHMVGEAARIGFLNLIYLASIISINLGLFNLLPIPALDGSRLLFILIEGLRGKPIDPEKEGLIHLIGFAILMMLMVFIAYKDFIRFDLL